jgi:general secretion pathway protein G
MKTFAIRKRHAFSLMELLAVVTILGIIAAIIVPRVSVSSDTAKAKVNDHNKATINASVERWYIEKGTWPAANLSDIGADVNYFPSAIPTNPVSGAAYTLNATTHRVN